MVSEKMYELGTKKSTIRTIFEYGRKRALEVGEENIYDFSIGNPNVPAPDFVKQAIIDILNEMDPCAVHGYTVAPGNPEVREVLAKDINRPDFAILYYPVISFDNKMAHQGSKKNLLGKNIDNEKLIDYYSLNKQVDDKTPKTLLLLSYDDRVVPPMNSILYYIALNEHHIPASLHMFPNGGHGWGIRYDFAYYQEVKDLILKWLRYTQIID